MRVFDRFAMSSGAVGWVYRYRNRAPAESSGWISSGLEVSVQLAGSWLHEGRWSGRRRVEPGAGIFMSPGEVYSQSHRAAPGEVGVQVGFLLPSGVHPLLCDPRAELRWTPAARVDRRLVELARYVQDARDRGEEPAPAVVEPALAELVARRCELVPRDGVLLARSEIDRTLDAPLYMRHFAEVAGLGEASFTRRFVARFGVSPARYRLLVRINAAGRLLASGPPLACGEIARRVGFEDASFFHRTFRAVTGLTPLRYAERVRRDPEDASA